MYLLTLGKGLSESKSPDTCPGFFTFQLTNS